jgi:hypothetical protein
MLIIMNHLEDSDSVKWLVLDHSTLASTMTCARTKSGVYSVLLSTLINDLICKIIANEFNGRPNEIAHTANLKHFPHALGFQLRAHERTHNLMTHRRYDVGRR